MAEVGYRKHNERTRWKASLEKQVHGGCGEGAHPDLVW